MLSAGPSLLLLDANTGKPIGKDAELTHGKLRWNGIGMGVWPLNLLPLRAPHQRAGHVRRADRRGRLPPPRTALHPLEGPASAAEGRQEVKRRRTTTDFTDSTDEEKKGTRVEARRHEARTIRPFSSPWHSSPLFCRLSVVVACLAAARSRGRAGRGAVRRGPELQRRAGGQPRGQSIRKVAEEIAAIPSATLGIAAISSDTLARLPCGARPRARKLASTAAPSPTLSASHSPLRCGCASNGPWPQGAELLAFWLKDDGSPNLLRLHLARAPVTSRRERRTSGR